MEKLKKIKKWHNCKCASIVLDNWYFWSGKMWTLSWKSWFFLWNGYINKWFKEKKIPEEKYFKSSLTNKNIDVQIYENGEKMFTLINFKNMLEYYMWYCKLDAVLLAEIMVDLKKDRFNHLVYQLMDIGRWVHTL